MVSVSSWNGEADGLSEQPAISADGRYVAFSSSATNINTDGPGVAAMRAMFRHDRFSGETITLADQGTNRHASISSDGSVVAFDSDDDMFLEGDDNGERDIYVWDDSVGLELVSISSSGQQSNGQSQYASISGDGRFVAFESLASNLVPGDTNGWDDVFVRDRQTGETTRVSVSTEGDQGNFPSRAPAISADGRYVGFSSGASNLVPEDTNGVPDIFVHDRETGETTRIAASNLGYGPSLTADGRYVAFYSAVSDLVPGDTNGVEDAFLHDRETGQTIRVSISSDGEQANNASPGLVLESRGPSVSADGRYVAFGSFASNLVPGDTNGAADIFVHDSQTGDTTRMSVSSAGEQGDDDSGFLSAPAVSADGRYVAFSSHAGNLVPEDTNDLVDLFLRDCESQETTRVSVLWPDGSPSDFGSELPSVSAEGRYVAFEGCCNLVPGAGGGGVFVRDRQAGETTRVSISSAGEDGFGDDPDISDDGRYVAFDSSDDNLVPGDTNGLRDVFVHDRQTGETTLVSVSSSGQQADGASAFASISGDGLYVAFASDAGNLVPGDTNGVSDIFVHDRQTGETTRVSVSSAGEQANGPSYDSSISGEGLYVAFATDASNLVPGDTNGVYDIFVHDSQTGETTRVSVSSAGEQANGLSDFPSISNDGQYVAFDGSADNLVPGDTNGVRDIFVHDRQTGETTRVSVSSSGQEANGGSSGVSISPDGRYVAFQSGATNLVPGDTNGWGDVFVHDCQTGETTRVSVSTAGEQADKSSSQASISGDGRHVAFRSFASNLVPDQANGQSGNVFLRDRQPCPCPADLDGDGVVGVTDFLNLLAAWGPNPGHPADLNGDGVVGTEDFLALLAGWGPCP